MGTKATKVGKNQLWKQNADSDKTAQGIAQAIAASHMTEGGTDSEIGSDQEQLDMDFLLIIESDNNY